MKYTSKPVTVEAVKYDAPDTNDSDGNLAELDALAGQLVHKQVPWNPVDGQNCALLILPALELEHDVDGAPTRVSEPVTAVIKPGDYLVLDDGLLSVIDGALFEALYDTSVESGTQDHPGFGKPMTGGTEVALGETATVSNDPTGQHADGTE